MKAGQVKELFDNAKRRVMLMTGITAEHYNKLVFERGIEFLELETGADEWAISMMSHTSIFWGWWRNIWCRRDLLWLKGVQEKRIPPTLQCYLEFQSIDSIDSYPSTLIYQESYHQLVSKINEDAKRTDAI
jgi:hypothetical protein